MVVEVGLDGVPAAVERVLARPAASRPNRVASSPDCGSSGGPSGGRCRARGADPRPGRRGSRRRASPGRRGSRRAGRGPADLVGPRRRGAGEQEQPVDPVGLVAAHSSARIPPMEPPTTHAQRSMPSSSASAASPRPGRAASPTGTGCPTPARRGGRRRPGAALTAAEHVRRDDEPPLRVERLTGPDERVPPAGGGVTGPGGPATWLSPVSACSTSTALERSARASPRSRRRAGPRAVHRPLPAAAGRPGRRTAGGRGVALPPGTRGREGGGAVSRCSGPAPLGGAEPGVEVGQQVVEVSMPTEGARGRGSPRW